MRFAKGALCTVIALQGSSGFTYTFKNPTRHFGATTPHRASPSQRFATSETDEIAPVQFSPLTATTATAVADKNTETTTTDEKIEEVRNSMGFRNDGQYWFMKMGLGIFQDGQRLSNGVPTDLDPSQKVSDDVVAERRRIAAQQLTNIDGDESDRRMAFGKQVLVVTALYAAYLNLFVDDGDFFGHVVRLSVFPLFSTGYGFYESGKKSL